MASEDVMGRHEMIVVAVGQRANHRVSVGAGGQARQVFADEQAGHFGSGGLELAANFRRGVGFEVEGIEVARGAGEEDDDDGLRFAAGRGPGPLAGGRDRRQQGGEAEPQQSCVADLEPFAAIEAGVVAGVDGGSRRHGATSFQAGWAWRTGQLEQVGPPSPRGFRLSER